MTTEVKEAAAVYRLEDLDVQEVSVVDRGANKRTFLVVKRDQEKAVWSTAYVNDLPDSAFLHIKPGGRKDDDGKTVPRTLRMFPVRDDAGKIDLPHLRNAIARIPVANIAADLKNKLQAQARRMGQQPPAQTHPRDRLMRLPWGGSAQDLIFGSRKPTFFPLTPRTSSSLQLRRELLHNLKRCQHVPRQSGLSAG